MPVGTPGKILLIDDDPDIQSIYGEILTQAGYRLEVALDGEDAYSKILQGGYDLILLDIMLPKIDGLGILKRLKEHPPNTSSYNGPIIVLSQLNQPEIINSALSLGAKGYIVKSSLTPDQVLAKVTQILQSP